LSLLIGTLGLGFNAAMPSSGEGEGFLMVPSRKSRKPMEISLSVANMDMSGLAVLFPPSVKPKGSVSGEFSLVTSRDSLDNAAGALTLTWKKGTIPLNLDTVPLDALTFETLDVDVRIEKGILSIAKADFAGEMSGSMRGSVRLSNALKRSRLNITGELTLPESMRGALGAGGETLGQPTRFSLRGSLDLPRFRMMTPSSRPMPAPVRPVQQNTLMPPDAIRQQQETLRQPEPLRTQDAVKLKDTGEEQIIVPEGGENE
jgi:hypothetical protein